MAGSSEASPGSNPVIDTQPTNTPDQFSFKNATFEEVLEELSSRFILNLPEDELAEVERVCFQVEQAHWYYEDFIRDENPSFPSLPLKRFSEILFHSCPLLHHWSHDHETAFNGFMSYKTRVPVCGAIMLNEALTKCVLVKGWKSSAGWGFPKGKVNENEDEAFCAVREVLEETGYNLGGQIRRTDCIRLCIKQQPITLFVVAGVPEDFPFKTQTRKEISKIDWFKLADLPTWRKNTSTANKFYLITPVISPLKAIVRTLRKTRKAARLPQQSLEAVLDISISEVEGQPTGDDATASESPMSIEPSSQSQSGEAEVSSSQSSSIDPHTPSVHGDLPPHTSDDALVVKHDFSTSAEDVVTDTELVASMAVMSSSLDADPRAHWSRLMTRLNNSEESSPRATPQASTPTPSNPPNTTRSEPQRPDAAPLTHARMMNGSVGQDHSGANPLHRTSKKHPNLLGRPLSMTSFPFGQEASSTHSAPFTERQLPASPDSLVKQTRQLQLLDSVLAEESARQTPQPTPPMSAHTLGAYPRGSFPEHIRAPLRSASVNPDIPRNLTNPFSHQPTLSVSSISGVLPSLVPASLQYQFIRPSQPYLAHQQPTSTFRNNAQTLAGGRPATAMPPQLPLAIQGNSGSHLPNPSLGTTTYTGTDSAHRGQMLSILSGGPSMSRSSTSGSLSTGVGSASALHSLGSGVISSHGSFSPAVTSHPAAEPRSANPLLSILNDQPTAGRASAVPVSVSALRRES